MRTLFVEDEPAQRERVETTLAELGLCVTAVGDGDSGLLAHLRTPFELMIIDWVTPGMDGLQLVQRVRAMTGGERPYILVVTGRDRPSDLERVIDAGADDYLAKPLELELLRTRLMIAQRRITRERHHLAAQQALAQSEVDFRRVIERCPLGVIAERDGELVYVNDEAAKTLGRRRPDLQGARFVDLVDPSFRALAGRRSARFARTKVPPPPMDMSVVRPDGQVRSVRVIPATSAAYGGDRLLFTLVEDITERERAQRELRLTQYAVDHAGDAAFWIREDGTITYANHAACTMLGHGPSQVVGARVPDFVADKDSQQWPRLRELLFQGARAQRQTVLQRADGTRVPVEVTANSVDFDGERILIAFARDLTERRRLQAGLHQADRLASVGSLAAGVAHEINNPLAYVIANLELLAEDLSRARWTDGPSRAEVERTLREASEGAHRVRKIVHDLKSFARADDGGSALVDVVDVLEVAIDIASNELRHRASLVREHEVVAPVRGNSGRLSQVFLNLLLNAAHAIPEGGRAHRIVTRVRQVESDVVVEIEDTGQGIAPGILDRIFDPFFTTKPQGLGTGLGLSICHGIVTAMGGTIEVDSKLGRGTLMRLRLPSERRPTLRAVPDRAEAPPQGSDLSLHILVVDDEPLICDGIRRALAHHRVEAVSSGAEAIHRCVEYDYDLVLCDVMMPDIAGTDVYERVREARPGVEERFVFMTGGAFTPKAREFLDAVQNEHIAKPFSLGELRSLVSRWATKPPRMVR